MAFRGTQAPGIHDPLALFKTLPLTLKDTITDLQIAPTGFHQFRVHSGFAKAYQDLIENLPSFIESVRDKGQAVWFTGHSLGGALATLGAAEFGEFQGLYTFGAPRVGDAVFVASLGNKNCFRVVYHDDVVTRLPPPFVFGFQPIIYRHAGLLVFIDEAGAITVGDTSTHTDVFSGDLNPVELIRSIEEEAGALAEIFGSEIPVSPEGTRVPPGPVQDHAPAYYTHYLQKVLG